MDCDCFLSQNYFIDQVLVTDEAELGGRPPTEGDYVPLEEHFCYTDEHKFREEQDELFGKSSSIAVAVVVVVVVIVVVVVVVVTSVHTESTRSSDPTLRQRIPPPPPRSTRVPR